jgi:hypothetical protein
VSNPTYEPFLAKRVYDYFSVKARVREMDTSKFLGIFIVIKNIFVSHTRHLTLVISDHDVFFSTSALRITTLFFFF